MTVAPGTAARSSASVTVEAVPVAAHDEDAGAFPGQSLGGGQADPARATGDQDRPAGHPPHDHGAPD